LLADRLGYFRLVAADASSFFKKTQLLRSISIWQPKMTMFPYKCVLVIGATSGIGRGLAEKIIGNGGKVIAVGRRQENLDELVRKHGENRVSGIRFDITDLDGIPNFVDT
jgi:NADPH:quinone reductase-like Zn-dependent oxidoreductase